MHSLKKHPCFSPPQKEAGTLTFTDMATVWTVMRLQCNVRVEGGKVNQKMIWHVAGLLDSEISPTLGKTV